MTILTMRRLLLSVLPAIASAVTGHGPRGVHPIDSRYVAVVDSSIDSVLVVDGNSGGAVVGHLVLHDRRDDDNKGRWLNPLSVATCDECKHLFVVTGHMLYAIPLDRPLAIMAENHDFSALSGSTVRPFWPDNWSAKYQQDGLLRAVSIAYDGSSAYVAHASGGVFSFDPLNPTESNRRSRHVIKIGQADIGEDINGLHHTPSLKNLIITRSDYVHIVKIMDEEGDNPLDYGEPVAYQLALDYHCSKLYDGKEMAFMDTVIINQYAFLLGKPLDRSNRANGVEIYRLTWYDDDEAWHDCVNIAGSGLNDAAWIDGSGYDARFSATPHDMAILPTEDSHTIVVGDVDNRALRYVDVTIPVETKDRTDRVRVTSVAYDEDLYQVLYSDEEPWTNLTPETVMAQDGKSYYHSGEDSVYSMYFEEAQDECGRVGLGRVCTLPEIRARFARGQYPSVDGDDDSWSTVWTAEGCSSCHLERPGRCDFGGADSWGEGHKMIAIFNPRVGLQMQCVPGEAKVDTMSMCCGLGGPAVIHPQGSDSDSSASSASSSSSASAASSSTSAASSARGSSSAQNGANGGGAATHPAAIGAYVVVPLLIIALAGYALYMRKKAKPSWWPKFLRNDQREETGHAPHREVDLRGRDYI